MKHYFNYGIILDSFKETVTQQQGSAVAQAMMVLLAQVVGKALIVNLSVKTEDGDQTARLSVEAVSMQPHVIGRLANVTFVRLDLFYLFVRNHATLINGEKTASTRAFVATMNPAIGKLVFVQMTSVQLVTRGSHAIRRVLKEHGDRTVMELAVLVWTV